MNSLSLLGFAIGTALLISACTTPVPGVVQAKRVGVAVDPGLLRGTKVHIGTTVFTNSTAPMALPGFNPAAEFKAAIAPGVQVTQVAFFQETRGQIPAMPDVDVVVVLKARGASGGSGYYNAAAGMYVPMSIASPGGPVFKTESFLGIESTGTAEVTMNLVVYEGASGKRVGVGGSLGTVSAKGITPSMAMKQALRDSVQRALKALGLLNPQIQVSGSGFFNADFGAPKSMTSATKPDAVVEEKEDDLFKMENPFDPNRKKSKIELGLEDLQKKSWDFSKRRMRKLMNANESPAP